MIRKLMASSALAALVSAGALTFAQAQTEPVPAPAPAEAPAATQDPAITQDPALGVDPAAPAADTTAPAAEPAAPEEPPEVVSDQPTLTPNQPTIASAFMGKSVFSSQDPQSDNIGDVSDLIIGQEGKITHAVIGVGGFLGIGQKDVAVPFQELQVVQQDGDLRLIYAATREQLEAAEPYDRATYDPAAREQAEEAQEQPQDPAAQPAGQDPAQPQQDGFLQRPTRIGGRAIIAAGVSLGGSAESARNSSADAEVLAQDATTVPADQQPAAAPPPTETEQQLESGNASAQSGTVAPAAGNLAFVSFSPDQVRASALMGQELYGSGDDTIGEVSDLVLQSDGKTRAALVDVGGFLGIGEKRVSIPFDQIQMQEQPAAQTGTGDMTAAPAAGTADPAAPGATVDPAAQGAANTGSADPAAPPSPAAQVEAAEPRLMVNMTREQLEQLPEYQDPQDQAAQAAADQAAMDPNAAGTAGIGTATTGTAATGAADAGTATADANAGRGTAGTVGTGAADAGTATTTTVTTDTATTGGVAGTADPNAPGATGGAVTTTTTDGGAAAGQGSAEAQDQFQPVTTEVGTDDLMGATVFSNNDDNLGKVGDLVFDRQGAIQAVVVDVGGFLGIGAKSVAIPYTSMQIMQNAGGDVRMMVEATQEQLEAAPEYTATIATGQTEQTPQ